jgi:hypothetical protein
MFIKTISCITLVALALGMGSRCLAQGTYHIAGPSAVAAPGSGVWGWSGSDLQALRTGLKDPAQFGPVGAVKKQVNLHDLDVVKVLYPDVHFQPWGEGQSL